MFKKINLLVIGLLFTSSFILTNVNNFKDIKTVKADVASEDIKVYLNTNGNDDWKDSASPIIRIWIEGDEVAGRWINPKPLGNNYYSFILPEGYQYLRAHKMQPSHTADSNPNEYTDRYYNRTGKKEYDSSYNCLRIGSDGVSTTNAYFDRTVNGFLANEDLYVNLEEYDNWFNDDSHTFIYATMSDSSNEVYEMNKVDSNINLVKYTFDSNKNITNYRIVRGHASFDDDHVSDKYFWTNEINAVKGYNGINISSLGEVSSSTYVNDLYLSNRFGYHFLSLPICLDEGGLDSNYSSNWDIASSSYTFISSLLDDSDYIKNVSSEGSEYINLAMKRYDTAINKNTLTLTNFINRDISSLNQLIDNVKQNNSNVVIIVSLLSLIALGGLLFFRKNK